MPNIRHILTINNDASDIYEALSTQKGLAKWFTTQNDAKAEEGALITFRFGEEHYNKMKILKLKPNSEVKWECIEDGTGEWQGTIITYNMEEGKGKTILKFAHDNWKDYTNFFAVCNHVWGNFLESLKAYCETGEGTPLK